jgi:hypothetical protein
MAVERPWLEGGVALGFSLAILLPFLLFVGLGWPGDTDACVTRRTDNARNSCYCEAFSRRQIGEPGVRQPINTWSNLYALITGGVVAALVYRNRARGPHPGSNRMRSTSFYPLLYICVVIFLGLGSMWFHASLVRWGGVFDNLSMYTFANFLWLYSLARASNWDWPFYIGYPTFTVLFTVLNALGIAGFTIVLVVTLAYFALEITIAFMPTVRSDVFGYLAYYLPAALSFLAAVIVWQLSQSGGPLCFPNGFQFHGVWHVLAGVTAFMLYLYWRHVRR